MNLSQVFHGLLQASAEGFVWTAQQVPNARRLLQPPEPLGEWSTARHIFHMMFYEQSYALPSMQQWLGESRPSLEGVNELAAWAEGKDDIESLLAEFQKVRNEQIALLPKFEEPAWNTTRETIWGPVTLFFIVSKTFQHTAEHTNDVMRIVISWDKLVEQQKARNAD